MVYTRRDAAGLSAKDLLPPRRDTRPVKPRDIERKKWKKRFAQPAPPRPARPSNNPYYGSSTGTKAGGYGASAPYGNTSRPYQQSVYTPLPYAGAGSMFSGMFSGLFPSEEVKQARRKKKALDRAERKRLEKARLKRARREWKLQQVRRELARNSRGAGMNAQYGYGWM